jgi:hypothetical protein
MATNGKSKRISAAVMAAVVFFGARAAHADEASVSVGHRFADPPPDGNPGSASGPIASDHPSGGDDRFVATPLEPVRSPFRLQLGPAGVSTGHGFGLGVGLGADFGTGSVGGRLSAAWLRGEGTRDGGASTPTGDMFSQYGAEVTLDPLKHGPLHPLVGMGIGLVHVSRPDGGGFAGAGTGRLGLEYALGLDDADVRIGASVTGGLIGPVADEIRDLRGYALVGAHLAIGF